MKIMKLALVPLLMSSSIVLADDGAGVQHDMSKMTCGEFLEMSAPDATMTLFWMDGYLTQKKAVPVWDRETFVQHRDKLITICTEEEGSEKLVLEEIQNLG